MKCSRQIVIKLTMSSSSNSNGNSSHIQTGAVRPMRKDSSRASGADCISISIITGIEPRPRDVARSATYRPSSPATQNS